MGKLKNALIEFEEQRMAKKSLDKDPRNSGLEDSDQARQQYEKEFNDWLDRFEQSFGSQENL